MNAADLFFQAVEVPIYAGLGAGLIALAIYEARRVGTPDLSRRTNKGEEHGR